jgi:hypothetical protein
VYAWPRAKSHEDSGTPYLIDTLRGRIVSAPGRPSTTENNYSLPFSCSLPSRIFHLLAPTRFKNSSTNSSYPISPNKDHSRSDPPSPTRFPIFFLRKFISQFRPHALCSPPYCFMVEFIQWLCSKSAHLKYLSLIWIFSPGRTTRSTVAGAPPLEEEHRSLHVLDNAPVVFSTPHSTQRSSQELIVDLRWHHTRTPGSVT